MKTATQLRRDHNFLEKTWELRTKGPMPPSPTPPSKSVESSSLNFPAFARKLWSKTLVLLLAVALPVGAAADDTPSTWITRAIDAHGGNTSLEAPPRLILRGDMTARFRRGETEGSIVIYREDDKERSESTFMMRGALRDFVSTWDGTEAWREFFGRKSDLPARPAQSTSSHRPEVALLKAHAMAREVVVVKSTEDGEIVLSFKEDDGPTKLALDRETAQIRWIEYAHPNQQGLDELKLVTRRDTYQDWQETPSGFLLARSLSTELDGVFRLRLKIDSVEEPEDLADDLFRMSEDMSNPLPGDELAE